MKIIKDINGIGIDIFIEEGEKYLAIIFGGNGNLYWSIYNEKKS